jgi:hypothetical protein
MNCPEATDQEIQEWKERSEHARSRRFHPRNDQKKGDKKTVAHVSEGKDSDADPGNDATAENE